MILSDTDSMGLSLTGAGQGRLVMRPRRCYAQSPAPASLSQGCHTESASERIDNAPVLRSSARPLRCAFPGPAEREGPQLGGGGAKTVRWEEHEKGVIAIQNRDRDAFKDDRHAITTLPTSNTQDIRVPIPTPVLTRSQSNYQRHIKKLQLPQCTALLRIGTLTKRCHTVCNHGDLETARCVAQFQNKRRVFLCVSRHVWADPGLRVFVNGGNPAC